MFLLRNLVVVNKGVRFLYFMTEGWKNVRVHLLLPSIFSNQNI